MNKAVIIAAKRTPIGKIGGILKDIPPEQLVAGLIKGIVRESGLVATDIDDVILGNVVGPGGNVARLAALQAGLPFSVPGVTVDRQCGSGLEAINLAARLVQSGAGDIFLAGGVESTSRAPWKIEKPRSLYALKGPEIFTRARFSPEDIGDPEMGMAAENVAERYGVTREIQDSYALASQRKAIASIQTKRFQAEIIPVRIEDAKRQTIVFDTDECPRQNTSLEKLAALPPVFKASGTVTAGNACPMNDGAAIVLIMSEQKAQSLGLKPLLTFVDAVAIGVDPNYLGIGPVPAVTALLKRNHLSVSNIDLVEFNEAFASQVIASLDELHIPWDKVNVGGGAIALGHPYGASGAVLVTRLCIEMQREDVTLGLATLGIGGGLGLATLFTK